MLLTGLNKCELKTVMTAATLPQCCQLVLTELTSKCSKFLTLYLYRFNGNSQKIAQRKIGKKWESESKLFSRLERNSLFYFLERTFLSLREISHDLARLAHRTDLEQLFELAGLLVPQVEEAVPGVVRVQAQLGAVRRLPALGTHGEGLGAARAELVLALGARAVHAAAPATQGGEPVSRGCQLHSRVLGN